MNYITIDLGGTMIKYGVVNEHGAFLIQQQMPTHAAAGAQVIYERLADLITELQNQYCIAGIAISTAGQVNPFTKTITYASAAIPDYINFNIGTYLEQKFQVPVTVENDVNCALLGEMHYGELTTTQNVMLTIGTGIGGAVSVMGHVLHGHTFATGEVGYLPMSGSTFQELASTAALIQKTEQLLALPTGSLTGEEVFVLARHDQRIQQLITDFYDTLAQGIATIIFLLGPETIVLGGAIANRKEFIIEIQQQLCKYVPDHLLQQIHLQRATLGNSAGMLGALAHFLASETVIEQN